jgi:hypothetical protein
MHKKQTTRSHQQIKAMISSQHKHTKKMKREGQTHLQNVFTKSTELTAAKTKGIRSTKSKPMHINPVQVTHLYAPTFARRLCHCRHGRSLAPTRNGKEHLIRSDRKGRKNRKQGELGESSLLCAWC